MKFLLLKQRETRWIILIVGLALITGLANVQPAFATSGYANTWSDLYPDSASDNAGCELCHGNSTGDLNPYGFDISPNCTGWANITAGINGAEGDNSDGDSGGYTNLEEINANAQPGWTTTAVQVWDRSDCTTNGTETYTGSGSVDPAPPEICDNEIDDNGNGQIDCADPECDGFVGGATICGDGACASTGNMVCQNPDQIDTCTPGTPSGEGPFGDATCSDSIDNDCDGFTDAADADCDAPPEICNNSVDDNGNGLIDCADPQCDNFVYDTTNCGLGACAASGQSVCQTPDIIDTCTPGTPSGEGPFGDATCSDSIDNDCDGFTDADDLDCDAQPEICDNGVDDNGNGLIDCFDPQCDGFVGGACSTPLPGICAEGTNICQDGGQDCVQNQPAGTEGPFNDATCSDGLDNDCNGQTDDGDASCQPDAEICDDGIDNNGNGMVDCEDPECDGFVNGACDTGNVGICAAGTTACRQLQEFCDQSQQAVPEGPFGDATCTDGLDNNCDGLTDADDPGCAELVVEICDNGIDDTGNGMVDCEDPECDGFVNGACDTGNVGICAAGTNVCQNGSQVCMQDQMTGTEGPFGSLTCQDGLDNDCNGLTDVDDPNCAALVADVYLSSLKTPKKLKVKPGQVVNKKATVRGDATLLTQDATVTLTGTGSAGIAAAVVTPASVTEQVVPGNPETRFEFTVSVSCEAAGDATVDWTATIDAPGNDDPTNDVLTGSTSVTCR